MQTDRTGRSQPTEDVASRWLADHIGAVTGIGLCVGGAVAAVGVGGLVGPLLVVGGLMAALVLVQREDRTDYVELVVWLWLLTPWVRRVVDLRTGYSDQSLVLLAAPVASMPGLATALFRPPHARPEIARAFAVAVVAVGYATLVGIVRQGASPSLIGGIGWLSPIGVGMWALCAPCADALLRRALVRLAVAGVLVLGIYGVYQFFVLPEWDAHWMENAPLVSTLRPEPLEVRVFGTMNSPVPYAMVLGALLMVAGGARSRWKVLAMIAGFAGLALSLVRAAWLGFVVATAALVSGGRARSVRAGLLLLLVPIVLVAGVGGPAREVVIARFDDTVEDGGEDTSLTDRLALYSEQLPPALTDVTGRGFGSVGAGVDVDATSTGRALRSPDSGILEALIGMGSLVGGAFLVAVVIGVVGAWRTVRHGAELERAAVAALVGLMVQAPLGNPFTSGPGALFWLLLAVAGRSVDGRKGDRAAVHLRQPSSWS